MAKNRHKTAAGLVAFAGVLVLAVTLTFWDALVVNYHVHRLRTDDAYLREALPNSSDEHMQEALRKYVTFPHGRKAIMRLYFETFLSELENPSSGSRVEAQFRDMTQMSHLVLWTKEQYFIADFHGLGGPTLSIGGRIKDGSTWQILGPIVELLPELAGKEVHLPEYQDRVFRAVAALTLPEHVGFEYELTGARMSSRRAVTPAASTPETSGWAVLVQKSLQSTKHSTTSKGL